MGKKISIEQLYSDRFRDLDLKPPASADSRVFDEINKAGKVKASKKYIAYAAAAVIAVSAIFFFFPIENEIHSIQNSEISKSLIQPTNHENENIEAAKSVVSQAENKESTALKLSEKEILNSQETVCGFEFVLPENANSEWKTEESNVDISEKNISGKIVQTAIVSNEISVKFTLETDRKIENLIVRFVEKPMSFAGNDTSVCGKSVVMNASDVAGIWLKSEMAKFSDIQNPKSSISSEYFGKQKFVWKTSNEVCYSFDTVEIEFLESPEIQLELLSEKVCPGDEVIVKLSGSKYQSIDWYFDSGQLVSEQDNLLKIKYFDRKDHEISVFARNSSSCSEKQLLKIPAPVELSASFKYFAEEENAPSMVYFSEQSDSENEIISYQWNFGNGVTSKSQNPDVFFENPGKFDVSLKITDTQNCTDTYTQNLEFKANSSISNSNVFTPNGDGENDIFYFELKNIDEFHAVILNKNGVKIYEWNMVENGWDGYMLNGSPASKGMYYFVVKGVDHFGKKVEKTGIIYLLK